MLPCRLCVKNASCRMWNPLPDVSSPIAGGIFSGECSYQFSIYLFIYLFMFDHMYNFKSTVFINMMYIPYYYVDKQCILPCIAIYGIVVRCAHTRNDCFPRNIYRPMLNMYGTYNLKIGH